MENDKSVDEIYDIICDEEKIKSYRDLQVVQNVLKLDTQKFHMELPHDDIISWVAQKREEIFSKIPENLHNDFRWEHIGSTSIQGMPGTRHPDAVMLFKNFPPPKEVVGALLGTGFKYMGYGPMNIDDLWFILIIQNEGFLFNHVFKIHVTLETCPSALILLDTRDRCRENSADFEDYKEAKILAAKKLEEGDVMGYKQAKMSSKLLQELQSKYKAENSAAFFKSK